MQITSINGAINSSPSQKNLPINSASFGKFNFRTGAKQCAGKVVAKAIPTREPLFQKLLWLWDCRGGNSSRQKVLEDEWCSYRDRNGVVRAEIIRDNNGRTIESYFYDRNRTLVARKLNRFKFT